MADPHVDIVAGSAINPYSKQAPSKQNIADTVTMAGRVQYSKLLNARVDTQGTMRLDNGKRFKPYGANLQAQINGIDRPSTIAQVLVDEKLFEGIFATTEGQKYHSMIAHAVGDALKKSLASKNTYLVKLR